MLGFPKRSEHRRQVRGFTLIELMMAMAFLSILLISIAVATIHVAKLYDKGLTLQGVNQSGRDLSASIYRDATAASEVADNFVGPNEPGNATKLGRLCLGTVSYVWNPAETLRADNGVRYTNASGAQLDQIVMARVPDSGGTLCQRDASNNYSTNIPAEGSTELLKSANHDLALYSVDFQPFSTAAGRSKVYLLTYMVGTNEDQTIDSVDTTCKPPSDAQSNFNFCAVNNFELMIGMG